MPRRTCPCCSSAVDPDAIAACVLEFLADPAARARLGRVARERVGRFTWERAAVLAEESFRRAHASRSRR
jgi:glycosyltransferase involved in cell wall biosynthesis